MKDLPPAVTKLFWDVDPAVVDLERHRDYVMERVMSRGTWTAMLWLRSVYSLDALADFVRRKGTRLPPRDEAYWALITGVDIEQRRSGGGPPWAEEQH